jgi:hypothetical protein
MPFSRRIVCVACESTTKTRAPAATVAHDEFSALTTRLERAADILRAGDSRLQAIARRYYLVYTYAAQAAEKHGVRFRRGSDVDDDRRLTHQALPNIVRALYTSQNSGAVIGGGPGITRAGRLGDHAAYRYADMLQKDRKYADYGHGTEAEPYDITTVDERLRWANHLVEDLRTLL